MTNKANNADHLLTSNIAADNLVADLERHADAILRAAGSGLRHYTFDSTRAAILAAVLECFQAGYCEGVDSVLQPVGEA